VPFFNQWLTLLSAFIFILLLIRLLSKGDANLVMAVTALFLAAASILGLIRYGQNWNNSEFFPYEIRSNLLSGWLPGRYTNFFYDFASTGVSAVFIGSVGMKRGGFLGLGLVAAAIGILALADSRTSWLALLASSLVFFIQALCKHSERLMGQFLLSLLNLAVALAFLLSTLPWESGANGRFDLWLQAEERIFSGAAAVPPQSLVGESSQSFSPHNALLATALTNGLGAATILILVLVLTLVLCIVSLSRGEALPLSVFVGLIVVATGENTFSFAPPSLGVILLVLLTMLAYRNAASATRRRTTF